MSVSEIRTTLENELSNIRPELPTAWENVKFTPVSGVPFQKVNFLFSNPDQTTIRQDYSQSGYMQVTLFYPLQQGPGEAMERAEMIRNTFRAGDRLDSVIISRTPEIGAGRTDGDRYMVPVFVRFISFISEKAC